MSFVQLKQKKAQEKETTYINRQTAISITSIVVDEEPCNDSVPNTIIATDDATTSSLSMDSDLFVNRHDARSKGGRPRGTTIAEQRKREQCLTAAKNEVAERVKEKYLLAKNNKTIMKKNAVATTINQVTKK